MEMSRTQVSQDTGKPDTSTLFCDQSLSLSRGAHACGGISLKDVSSELPGFKELILF